jgi:hypothetical protein
MNNFKCLSILLVFYFLMSGCTALEKADKVIISGQAEKMIFNIEYTETEREIIQQAIAEYNAFHDKWKDFIESPVQLSALGNAKLMTDYEDIKNIYFAIEHIITLNFHRYNEETQTQLLKYQGMANDVDRTMGRIKTVSDVATYGAMVAQIATKML